MNQFASTTNSSGELKTYYDDKGNEISLVQEALKRRRKKKAAQQGLLQEEDEDEV